MCLGVALFGSNLFGTLCFLDLYVYFLYQIGEVFFIFSNMFSISHSSSSPSGTPMIWMWEHLKLSRRLLSFFSFFLNPCFFILFRFNGLFLPFVPNHWFQSQFLSRPGEYLRFHPLLRNRHAKAKKYGPSEKTDQNSRKSTTQWGDSQPIRCRVQNTGNRDAHRNDWVWLQNGRRKKAMRVK